MSALRRRWADLDALVEEELAFETGPSTQFEPSPPVAIADSDLFIAQATTFLATREDGRALLARIEAGLPPVPPPPAAPPPDPEPVP